LTGVMRTGAEAPLLSNQINARMGSHAVFT
jgi:hypothetical protein